MHRIQLERYRISRKICRKFCFTLYEAHDVSRNHKIFLKVLRRELAGPCVAQNFLRSARLGKVLRHNAIAEIHDYGVEGNHHYIVSEYLSGRPLSMFLQEEFPLPVQDVVDMVLQLADILRAAHLQGVVHGLLNPSTVYVGDGQRLKVDDFCFDWLIPQLLSADDAEALYLSYYAPPEVFFSSGALDGRADVYSLGVILMQLLANDLVFRGNGNPTLKYRNLASRIPAVFEHFPESIPLRPVLETALNPDAEKRFQNLAEFCNAMRACAAHLPSRPEPSSRDKDSLSKL